MMLTRTFHPSVYISLGFKYVPFVSNMFAFASCSGAVRLWPFYLSPPSVGVLLAELAVINMYSSMVFASAGFPPNCTKPGFVTSELSDVISFRLKYLANLAQSKI